MQCVYVHFFPEFMNSLPLPTVAQYTHTDAHSSTLGVITCCLQTS